MLLTNSLQGVIPVAPTPFLADGNVDFASIARMTEFFDAAGVNGITILGQLGEAPKLDHAEAYLNYTGSYLYFDNNIYTPVRAYTPVSLHFGVFPFSDGIFKTTQLTLDVDNVFNQDPPYVNTGIAGDNEQNSYDKQVANPIGRNLYAGLSHEIVSPPKLSPPKLLRRRFFTTTALRADLQHADEYDAPR